MKQRLRISQCMIVKNEERNIEKALSWGRDIMYEQIVVDTGSTDRTVELASAMGARMYHFPWTDDFAEAKNFAISKASGEWIALLDADEAFVPGDGEKLLGLLEQLQNSKIDAVASGWMQLNDEGEIYLAATQVRVFRNRPGLGYRRRVHEQLEWADKRVLRIADATKELSILHTGYCGEAGKEKTVSQRNRKLILRELEDHPDDYEMMGYLGDEYSGAAEWENAEIWYRKSIDSMPAVLDGKDQRSSTTFLRLMDIMCGRNAGREEIEAMYKKAVFLLPQEADFDYFMGKYCTHGKFYAEGALYYTQALTKLEHYGSYNKAMLLIGNLKETYEEQALCFLLSGQPQKAVNSSIAVLKAEPYSAQALYILLKAFRGEEEISSVSAKDTLEFIGKLYHMDLLKDKALIWSVSDKAGWPELKALVEDMLTNDEKSLIPTLLREG